MDIPDLPNGYGYDLECYIDCYYDGQPLWLCLETARKSFVMQKKINQNIEYDDLYEINIVPDVDENGRITGNHIKTPIDPLFNT